MVGSNASFEDRILTTSIVFTLCSVHVFCMKLLRSNDPLAEQNGGFHFSIGQISNKANKKGLLSQDSIGLYYHYPYYILLT